jgi:dienelactone hydrolase
MSEDAATAAEKTPRFWRRAWRRAIRWWLRAWAAVQPGNAAKRGATIALAVSVAVAGAVVTITWKPGINAVLDVVVDLLLAFFFLGIATLIAMLLVRLISFLPRFLTLTGMGLAVALLIALTGTGLPFFGATGAAISLGLLLVEALFGGAIALIASGSLRRDHAQTRRVGHVLKIAWVALLAAGGIGVNAYVVVWMLAPGTDSHLVHPAPDRAVVAPLDLPDPSKAGSFRVLTLTYGSGTDTRRPEFGSQAKLKTKTVDATPFVKGSEGMLVFLRHWFWNFDFKAFPVNGRVWYPDGPGPFPLVLIVHGNHDMETYSDPGYAYLGEHLASRGFILVSVDENFLNGSFRSSLGKENDARGWMLLQHLKVWKEWNETGSNPFRGKVAMDRIALMGHSRGGEAAAIAGAFNRMRYYPDDGTKEMPSGFGIRSIVAIAPVDGQYTPADRPTPLENVNYLTLQGAHDADMSVFHGIRQWARVRFTDGSYHAKAAVYTYRANHGQFNTVWGNSDAGFPMSRYLNHKALMPGDAQRQVAKVFITSFLEATLLDKIEYLDVLRDERRARKWLPNDLYITRFSDSNVRTVANFEEDVNLATASVDGGRIEEQGLGLWREQYLPFKSGNTRDSVVFLGWKEPKKNAGKKADTPERQRTAGPPSYTIVLPPTLAADWKVSAQSRLTFALSPVDEKVPDEGEDALGADKDKKAAKDKKDAAAEKAQAEAKKNERLDLSVELAAANGVTVRLPLSQFRAVPVLLESKLSKFANESAIFSKPSEPVLQSFELPLTAFVKADPRFDPATLTTIRFVFDKSKEGVLALDDVGIAVGSDAERRGSGEDPSARCARSGQAGGTSKVGQEN